MISTDSMTTLAVLLAISLAEINSGEACKARRETYGVDRAHYSQRIGRGPLANPTIEDLARALTLAVTQMWSRDYMPEWHGYTCVDAWDVGGRAAMSMYSRRTALFTLLGVVTWRVVPRGRCRVR